MLFIQFILIGIPGGLGMSRSQLAVRCALFPSLAALAMTAFVVSSSVGHSVAQWRQRQVSVGTRPRVHSFVRAAIPEQACFE
mmetsp:Transcript_18430/g.47239  ORF Transcript_18430/g.47239 Transcript_18430/m.47239 type:complete len:82 (-) Transcript_18430:1610-1855(-)